MQIFTHFYDYLSSELRFSPPLIYGGENRKTGLKEFILSNVPLSDFLRQV